MLHGILSAARVVNRVRVYESGELEVCTVLVNAASRPPDPSYGPRFTRGVGAATARSIRRAVVARNREGGCQWVLLTLTSQAVRSDEEMRAAFQRFLMWGRKYLGAWFEFYVWVAELQARGVLHFHLLLPKRIPPALFKRMRRLWAETYGMGPGSVDIRKMRSGKGAARYLGKVVAYLRKPATAFRLQLDGEGLLSWEPWRVGRDGSAYERVTFRGRGGDMSRVARGYAAVRVEFAAEWGAFPGLGVRGWSVYCESPEEAEGLLADWLGPPGRVVAA